MIKLNVHEAKTHLSRYLVKLEEGEIIVLCRRNVPIAEIRGLGKSTEERPIGLAKGEFEVPDVLRNDRCRCLKAGIARLEPPAGHG